MINNYVSNKGFLPTHWEEKMSGKLYTRSGFLKYALDNCRKEDATLLIAEIARLSRNVVFLISN
jgi:hypothetical protein